MDANFGLVRKKSSGCSYVQPKYPKLLFASQEDVDNFVKHYSDSDTANVRCIASHLLVLLNVY